MEDRATIKVLTSTNADLRDLVVVDDIGLLPLGADAAEGLYRLVDAAYEKRSVAISSNLHPAGLTRRRLCLGWKLGNHSMIQ